MTRIYNNVKQFRALRDSQCREAPFVYVKMIDSGSESENRDFLHLYAPVADQVTIEDPMNWNDYQNYDFMAAFDNGGVSAASSISLPYPKKICPFPFYSLVVNANSDVTVCCVDWSKKTKVGNLKNSSLRQIWRGTPLREFRRMHLAHRRQENEACRNCTFLFTTPDNVDELSESPEQWI